MMRSYRDPEGTCVVLDGGAEGASLSYFGR